MRDFHATPDLCPSPSRRRLLAGGGAALVAAPAAIALPLLANTGSPDAEYITTFKRYRERIPLMMDAEERDDPAHADMAKAEGRDLDILADMPVTTVDGAMIKLAMANYWASDFHQISHSTEPLPRALSSLRTSLPSLAPDIREAASVAADEIEYAATEMLEMLTAKLRAESGASNWREQEAIFERTGANKMLEARRRQNAAGPVNKRGYTEDEEDLAATLKAMSDDERHDFMDFATLMLLADKSCFALEHLGGDRLKLKPQKASVMRLIARNFAAAADRIDPPAAA